jgi:hypothetical protein
MMNTQYGPLGGYVASASPKSKRMAWMAVSRELFEERCGNLATLLEAADLFGSSPSDAAIQLRPILAVAMMKVRDAFLLPTNAEVIGVSTSFQFAYDQVAVKVECPDFREVREGDCVPQVDAMYYETIDLLGKRVPHWDGWSTLGVIDYAVAVKPERVSLDRCSEELGHFAMPGADICYCGQLWWNPETQKWAYQNAITPSEVRTLRARVPKGDCWQCRQLTSRRVGEVSVPGGRAPVYECESCGGKPLL